MVDRHGKTLEAAIIGDGELSYATLYPLLRQQISEKNGRFWRIRSWSLALAGGVFTLALPAAFGMKQGVTWQAAMWAAIGGCVLNVAFWVLALSILRGVYRIGAYLEWLETWAGLHRGWEHYVRWRHDNRLEPATLRLAYDVHWWLALSYVVFFVFADSHVLFATFNTAPFSQYSYGASVLAVGLGTVGSFLSARVASYRNTVRRDLREFVEWSASLEPAGSESNARVGAHPLPDVSIKP